ncbi:hypothetical protein ACFYYN_25120 [Streptomyces sp. NPDC001902]
MDWFTPAGSAPDGAYWSSPNNHALALRLDGTELGDPSSAVYVGYNGWSGDVDLTLPSPGAGKQWYRVTDTSTWAEGPDQVASSGSSPRRRRRHCLPPARPGQPAADREVARSPNAWRVRPGPDGTDGSLDRAARLPRPAVYRHQVTDGPESSPPRPQSRERGRRVQNAARTGSFGGRRVGEQAMAVSVLAGRLVLLCVSAPSRRLPPSTMWHVSRGYPAKRSPTP